jgi:hypothetical protein
MTANTIPNIKIDTGTTRRMDSFTHHSEFTKDINKVDEKNNIYLANIDFLKQIETDNKYLNAFCNILFEYGINWMNKKQIYKQTENFRASKEAIMSSNDIIQDFIDTTLTITNNYEHRINRNTMYSVFKDAYKTSLITPQQLLNALKQKKIIYEPDYRCDGLKGCYVGVELGYDEKESPLDSGVIKQKSELEKAFEEIASLKLQIKALKFNQEPVVQKVNKSTKIVNKVDVDDLIDDDDLENLISNII